MALLWIVVGVVGGALVLLLLALPVGFLCGAIVEAFKFWRRKGLGWALVGILHLISLVGAVVLVLAGATAFVAWLLEAEDLRVITSKLAGWSLLPALSGSPTAMWLTSRLAQRSADVEAG